MCFMIAITAYCQKERVKIMLFAGSEEPTDVIILNNKKIEPYDDSHLWHYVGQRVFFAQPCWQNSNCLSSIIGFCLLFMFILNTVNKLQ